MSFVSSDAFTSSRFRAKLRVEFLLAGSAADEVVAFVFPVWKRPISESRSRTLVLETCPVVSTADNVEVNAVVVEVGVVDVVIVVVVVVDALVDASGRDDAVASSLNGSVV